MLSISIPNMLTLATFLAMQRKAKHRRLFSTKELHPNPIQMLSACMEVAGRHWVGICILHCMDRLTVTVQYWHLQDWLSLLFSLESQTQTTMPILRVWILSNP